jgi:acyl-CoA thioesterase
MLDNDAYSRWLGIVIDDFREGYCKLHFTIREEMLNGFGIVHGGIVFAASDSAFAFACNGHGNITVALDVHISFVTAARAGETLTVEAREVHAGNRIGFYDITTTNGQGEIVALFKGTGYRTSNSLL